jgi:hypothetical protein
LPQATECPAQAVERCTRLPCAAPGAMGPAIQDTLARACRAGDPTNLRGRHTPASPTRAACAGVPTVASVGTPYATHFCRSGNWSRLATCVHTLRPPAKPLPHSRWAHWSTTTTVRLLDGRRPAIKDLSSPHAGPAAPPHSSVAACAVSHPTSSGALPRHVCPARFARLCVRCLCYPGAGSCCRQRITKRTPLQASSPNQGAPA